MLIADNSATNLAETCSQLRKLCHSSVKKLDLRPLLRDDVQPSDAQQWTQHLQEHFPGCSSVLLQVDEQDSYLAVSYMLPALARCVGLCTHARLSHAMTMVTEVGTQDCSSSALRCMAS
jgi:hypothetical protein